MSVIRITPRQAPRPRMPHAATMQVRAQLARLRDREASLETVCREAPKQLATIRSRIAAIEGLER